MKTYPPDHRNFIRVRLKSKRLSLHKLSGKWNRSKGYLSKALQDPDLRVGLLLQLSEALNENLLDHYIQALDPTLRPTAAERNLQQQLNDTQLQLKRVTEERDRYWQALSNKG